MIKTTNIKEEKTTSPKTKRKSINKNKDTKLISDGYEIIEPPKRVSNKMITVAENGYITLNKALCNKLNYESIEILTKPDASKIAIIKNGNITFKLPKTGKIHAPSLIEKIKSVGKELPCHFVGEWSEDDDAWIGEFTQKIQSKRSKNK